MTNNGWPDKPGVPLNPERDGPHWLKDPDSDRQFVVDWSADIGWRSIFTHDAIAAHMCYVAPCLTPAEVDARIAAAHKEWLAELNHDTDALMEAARQSALAECIAACDAIVHLYRVELPEEYKDKPGGIPHDWQQTWEGWAEIAEDIATDIRALSDTPPGMVLVPLEPTTAMIQAGFLVGPQAFKNRKTADWWPSDVTAIYSAMVKAAGKGEGDE